VQEQREEALAEGVALVGESVGVWSAAGGFSFSVEGIRGIAGREGGVYRLSRSWIPVTRFCA